MKIPLLTALLSVSLAASLAAQEPATPAVAASEPLAMELHNLAGTPQSLASLRGQIVVVNFWATWCVPCKEEMPLLSLIAKEYGQRGVIILGANADEPTTAKNIPKFLKRTRVDFPVWAGATTADMQRFGVGTALPATAFLDRNGEVAFRILGPLSDVEVRERLDFLLSNRKGVVPPAMLDNLAKALQEHEEETGHQHGSVSLEGASSVPS